MGVARRNFEGRDVENFYPTLNISITGQAIFAKFSGIAGLPGLSLHFEPEVGGGSNFQGSGGQSGQKWHCGLEVGGFERVSENLPHANF